MGIDRETVGPKQIGFDPKTKNGSKEKEDGGPCFGKSGRT
jgi:hypothetical protein